MTPEALQAEYSRKLQEVRETCRKIDALIEDLLDTSGSPTIPEVHNITFDPIGGRDGKDRTGEGRTLRPDVRQWEQWIEVTK